MQQELMVELDKKCTLPEAWYCLELFGHITVAGWCETQFIGDTAFLRVTVPEHLPMQIGLGALFRIRPCTKEYVRKWAESWEALNLVLPDPVPYDPEPADAFDDGLDDDDDVPC